MFNYICLYVSYVGVGFLTFFRKPVTKRSKRIRYCLIGTCFVGVIQLLLRQLYYPSSSLASSMTLGITLVLLLLTVYGLKENN